MKIQSPLAREVHVQLLRSYTCLKEEISVNREQIVSTSLVSPSAMNYILYQIDTGNIRPGNKAVYIETTLSENHHLNVKN